MAHEFRDQTVLLIGGGVSSMDIAKDLGKIAHLVIQSTRDGAYDLPAHLLPENAVRVGPIRSFNLIDGITKSSALRNAGSVTLADGRTVCNIDQVVVCTGYHVSFPYMQQYHSDGIQSADADESVLVTDGQQTHNLHKDIWYIPDPTLAFIGVPYHVATFSAFEFQAYFHPLPTAGLRRCADRLGRMALAAVLSGEVPLPSQETMRREYRERLVRKGAGRTFHSLKEDGQEVAYVNELADMVDQYRGAPTPTARHTGRWHEAYGRRLKRRDKIFAVLTEPAERRTLESAVVGC